MSAESGKPGDAAARLARAVEITSHVKHDVNNLLMGLLGHTALLSARPDLSEAARQKAALIEQQAIRIRDRIAELDAVRLLGET